MSLHTSINEKTDRTDQTQCRMNKTLQRNHWYKQRYAGNNHKRKLSNDTTNSESQYTDF